MTITLAALVLTITTTIVMTICLFSLAEVFRVWRTNRGADGHRLATIMLIGASTWVVAEVAASLWILVLIAQPDNTDLRTGLWVSHQIALCAGAVLVFVLTRRLR